MNGKYFIDTNIFIYNFDQSNPEKKETASNLIKNALLNRNGCISYQVIQEFINVSTRKFEVPLSIKDCKKYMDSVLFPLCEIFVNVDIYHRSLEIMERWQYSFYDSLIITSAIQADCNILYSEDFQHNQKLQSLTIINPFI